MPLRRLACVAAAFVAALSGAAAAGGSGAVVRVLVVRATYGPQPDVDLAPLEAAATAFFANASFGTVELEFTDTPWLTAYASDAVCDNEFDEVAAQGVAAAAQYDPGGYDRVVLLTPCLGMDSGSEITHHAIVGARELTAALFEHELGHTFDVSHAGALDCEGARCTLDPYGSPFDVMGSGIGDFGALQKAEAGWPVNVVTATVPGTYTLAAIEEPSTVPQALVVPRGPDAIWIEHRDAVGNDAYLRTSIWRRVVAGVLVHKAPADSLSVSLMQRRPDVLLGDGGPHGFFVAKGSTFTIPHVLAIDVLRHVGTTVTVRLRPLR